MKNEIYAVVDASIRINEETNSNTVCVCSVLVDEETRKAKIAIDAFNPKDDIANCTYLLELYGIIFSTYNHDWIEYYRSKEKFTIINDNTSSIQTAREIRLGRPISNTSIKSRFKIEDDNLVNLRDQMKPFNYLIYKDVVQNGQRRDLMFFHQLAHNGAFMAARKQNEKYLTKGALKKYENSINDFMSLLQRLNKSGWRIDM